MEATSEQPQEWTKAVSMYYPANFRIVCGDDLIADNIEETQADHIIAAHNAALVAERERLSPKFNSRSYQIVKWRRCH